MKSIGIIISFFLIGFACRVRVEENSLLAGQDKVGYCIVTMELTAGGIITKPSLECSDGIKIDWRVLKPYQSSDSSGRFTSEYPWKYVEALKATMKDMAEGGLVLGGCPSSINSPQTTCIFYQK